MASRAKILCLVSVLGCCGSRPEPFKARALAEFFPFSAGQTYLPVTRASIERMATCYILLRGKALRGVEGLVERAPIVATGTFAENAVRLKIRRFEDGFDMFLDKFGVASLPGVERKLDAASLKEVDKIIHAAAEQAGIPPEYADSPPLTSDN
jgi:hypothetical protein